MRDFPDGSEGKESACNAEDTGDTGSVPGLGKSLEKEAAKPSPVLLFEKSHGRRSLGATVYAVTKSWT